MRAEIHALHTMGTAKANLGCCTLPYGGEARGGDKYPFGGPSRARISRATRPLFDINFVDLIKIHGFRSRSGCRTRAYALYGSGSSRRRRCERTSSLTRPFSGRHRRRIFQNLHVTCECRFFIHARTRLKIYLIRLTRSGCS